MACINPCSDFQLKKPAVMMEKHTRYVLSIHASFTFTNLNKIQVCRYKWLISGATLLLRQTREQEIMKLTLWANAAGILHHVYIYFHVQIGDVWWDTDRPCMSFNCSEEGVQTVTKVCPVENCQEVRILLLHLPQRHNMYVWANADHLLL